MVITSEENFIPPGSRSHPCREEMVEKVDVAIVSRVLGEPGFFSFTLLIAAAADRASVTELRRVLMPDCADDRIPERSTMHTPDRQHYIPFVQPGTNNTYQLTQEGRLFLGGILYRGGRVSQLQLS